MNNKSSDLFCYAPWTHLYVNPDSRLLPCCLYEDKNHEFSVLNNTHSILESMNHPRMIQIRSEFIQHKIPAGCYKCESQMKMNMTPYKQKINNIAESSDKPIEILQDGTVEHFEPLYLDIRFGNLCNLKCLTCSPTFSSSIAVEFNKIHNRKNKTLHRLDHEIIDEIFNDLVQVKEIYLAGGEPLITEENYNLLNILIEHELDPSLTYNTNLTNIQYRDKQLTDLWNKFTNITVIVSLDGYKHVNDYIRYGSDYDSVINNILTVKQQTPHVKIKINSVASVMSMLSLPDLGQNLLSTHICSAKDIMYSIAHQPENMDPTVLPLDKKNQIVERWESYILWLTENNHDYDYIDRCRGLINYMMSKDNSIKFEQIIYKLQETDRFRNSDYKTIL
jgi:sulfatase maturation enzyme AslB (radical SAM superfamily)